MIACPFPTLPKDKQVWCSMCHRWTDKPHRCIEIDDDGKAADIAAGKLVRSSYVHVALGWVSE